MSELHQDHFYVVRSHKLSNVLINDQLNVGGVVPFRKCLSAWINASGNPDWVMIYFCIVRQEKKAFMTLVFWPPEELHRSSFFSIHFNWFVSERQSFTLFFLIKGGEIEKKYILKQIQRLRSFLEPLKLPITFGGFLTKPVGNKCRHFTNVDSVLKKPWSSIA